MRITDFQRMMAGEFGSSRASTLARDHVFSGLDGRTVEEAVEAGVPVKEIWQVVCESFDVPSERR
ncbi:DUF3046 domain-containing protein [Amycolatopsis sp.]|jgi:hypothetical protein|uniref:DUF3046 domain-containing protein n=1 Tax=Amycolatopsis sp. TaxID=37632 RepID=UPI002E0709A1|nr:DUF3046 domain-containing protein [Amycolatopsis sp.]